MAIVTGAIIIIGLIITIIATEVFGMIVEAPVLTQVPNMGIADVENLEDVAIILRVGAMIIINLAVAIIPILDAIIALILAMVTIVMVRIMLLKYYIQIV